MNSSQNKYEGWLYGLALLLAIALRLIQLGAGPLTDSEANLALQSFYLAQGKSEILAPQPAYILFTSLFFAVIESTNFMARIISPLVGSALAFLPYFFRNKLGTRPALILAFLFAFDPGLVALARQAGGTILAVTFLLFAWGLWMNRRETAAGIFLGLALLAGPSVWSGVLTLLLTSIFLRGIQSKPTEDQPIENRKSETVNSDTRLQIRNLLISLVTTVLLAGTLFFTV